MRRLSLGLGLLILLRADMYQDAGNAKLPQARTNLGVGAPVSIRDHGARADAVQWPDGVVAAGSTAFSSASASFTQADVGKVIQIDGAGGLTAAVALGQPAVPPLATTIAAYVGPHAVTLAAPAVAATPRWYAAAPPTVTPRTSGNYVPGDILAVTGGTSATQAKLTVISTAVTATSIGAGGTGGTNGACVVAGTTGTGSKFRQNVTISGGAITALGSIAWGGHYYANPAALAAEPVTNAAGYACAPTGATLSLAMGVDGAAVSTPGDYGAVPANPVATGVGSISAAAGATFNVTWNHSGGFVYGTDDSQALKAAIEAAGALFAQSQPSYVFLPAGNYLIDAVETPVMRGGVGGPVGIVGEGSSKSNLIVGANYAGDVFAWSEAWIGDNLPLNGTGSYVTRWNAGARAVGFSIVGNRTAAAKQNALVFYDRTDELVLDDVDVQTLNGRCLYFGALKNSTEGYLRESRISRLRCFGVGSAALPNIEFITSGSGDQSNTNIISQVDIYAPYSTGFWIHTRGAGFQVDRLRIEGLQWAAIPADLVLLGDAGTGQVAGIQFNDPVLLSAYPGQAAMRITAPNTTVAPYFIRVGNGNIGGGMPHGYGVLVEAGRNLEFEFSDIYSWNTGFTTGALAGLIALDGGGQERSWTYSLASPLQTSTPFRRVSATSPAGPMVTSCVGVPPGTLWNNAGVVNVCP